MAPPVEISIPSTSLRPAASSDNNKPYTVYNITLRLPLRSFVVQKRYSEFAALHAALTSLVGEQPPTPLPGKSWFRSTTASAELTETRRAGLEAYLRTIAESPDRRWRDTSAWRAFLNLPSTPSTSGRSNNSGSIESKLPAIGPAASNAAAASDPGTWIDLHKEMKRALHEARLQLARRDAESGGGFGSSSYSSSSVAAGVEAGAAAKRELIKAGSLLSALTAGLAALQEAKRLGDGEVRRRRDLLAAARVERDGLETLSTSLASARVGTGGAILGSGREGIASTGERASLFAGASASKPSSGPSRGGRVLGTPLPETERTRDKDNVGVAQLQRQMMKEQDNEVDQLAKIVQRQKELGLAIKQEVDAQAPMLEQMQDDVDRVQGKMKVAKERVKRLG